ncbi:MAG: hypothetical protein ABL958_12200 [Bdellovibrionia bacterium]
MQAVQLSDAQMETVKGGNLYFKIFVRWIMNGETVYAPGNWWGDSLGSCYP